MKKYFLTTMVALLLSMTLSGCVGGKAELTIKKDASCEIKYVMETNALISSSSMKENVEKTLSELNKKASKTIYVIKNIEEKDGNLVANILLKDINDTDNGDYFGSLQDYLNKTPEDETVVKDINTNAEIKISTINRKGKYKLFKTSNNTLINPIVNLPTKAIFINSNVGVINDKQVELKGKQVYILLEDSGFNLLILIPMGFVFMLFIAIVVILKRKEAS